MVHNQNTSLTIDTGQLREINILSSIENPGTKLEVLKSALKQANMNDLKN